MKREKIVAFIGYSGSGKDWYSTIEESKIREFNHLIGKYKSVARIGFSDGVRKETFEFFNSYPRYGEEYDNWKKERKLVHPTTKMLMTGREGLILIGEAFRKNYPEVWSDYWINSVRRRNLDYVIVNDCRFIHEAKAVMKVAKQMNYDVEFHFTNYRSERYNKTNGDTDELARLVEPLITNKIIANRYDVTEVVKNLLKDK